MRHDTRWEDGMMAGVVCDGKDVGTITSYEDEPWVCVRCGATLRLVWDVRLEEVAPGSSIGGIPVVADPNVPEGEIRIRTFPRVSPASPKAKS